MATATSFIEQCVFSVSALAVSSTLIMATTAAEAAEAPRDLAAWTAAVERTIDRELQAGAPLTSVGDGDATVVLTLDSGHRVVGAELADGTGVGALDREAKRVAGALGTLPPLPQAFSGQPLRVAVELHFAAPASALGEVAARADLARTRAAAADHNSLVAARAAEERYALNRDRATTLP